MDLLQHFFRKRVAGRDEEDGKGEKPEAKSAAEGAAPVSFPTVEQTMAAAAARWRLARERGSPARPGVPPNAPAAVAAPVSAPAQAPPASPAAAPAPGEIVLVLDDILPRLPTECLKPGLHDPERELRLPSEDLVAGIARGRATIPLSQLAARYPDVFQAPRTAAADIAVYLPLQKLLRQLSTDSPKGALPPRVEATITPARRALPPDVAETLLKPLIHGDLHGLAASSPPPPPPDEELPRNFGPAAARLEPAPETPEPPAPRVAAESAALSDTESPAAAPPRAVAASPVFEVSEAPIEPIAPPAVSNSSAPESAPAPAPTAELHSQEVFTPKQPEPASSAETPAPREALESRDSVTPPGIEAALPAPVTPTDPDSPKGVAGETGAGVPPVTSRRGEAVGGAEPDATAPASSEPAPAQFEAPAAGTPPPPLFAQHPFAPVDTAAPAQPAPAVPLPFFSSQAPMPAPPPQPPTAPVPRITPPPLRMPAREEPGAVRYTPFPTDRVSPREETPPVAADAEPPPLHDPSQHLRIAPPIPAATRPPAINLYAGVQISAPPEPVVVPEPVAERTKSAEPLETLEHEFEPAVPAEAPPSATGDPDPEPEPIVGTDVPAAPAARPPDYPLELIEQAPLQAIFMTDETLDLPRISQLSAALPGVSGCLILAGESLAQGGERPAGLDAQTLRDLSARLTAAAQSVQDKLHADSTFTLYGGNRALSLFARQQLCLCVVHGTRGFLPGVRERLAAVADTLARGLEEPAA